MPGEGNGLPSVNICKCARLCAKYFRGIPLILTTTLTGEYIIVPIMRTQRPRNLTSKWWGSNASPRKGDVAGVLSRGHALET